MTDTTNNTTPSDPPDLPSFRPLNRPWLLVITLLYSAIAIALFVWTHNKYAFVLIVSVTLSFGPGGLYACRTLPDIAAFIKFLFTDGGRIGPHLSANIRAFCLFLLAFFILLKLSTI